MSSGPGLPWRFLRRGIQDFLLETAEPLFSVEEFSSRGPSRRTGMQIGFPRSWGHKFSGPGRQAEQSPWMLQPSCDLWTS